MPFYTAKQSDAFELEVYDSNTSAIVNECFAVNTDEGWIEVLDRDESGNVRLINKIEDGGDYTSDDPATKRISGSYSTKRISGSYYVKHKKTGEINPK